MDLSVSFRPDLLPPPAISQVQFHDVLVVQDMLAADGLAVEDPRAPDTRGFEAGGEIAVHQASHLDQSAAGWTGKGGSQIRRLARLLGVNANDMEEPVQGRAQLFQPR